MNYVIKGEDFIPYKKQNNQGRALFFIAPSHQSHISRVIGTATKVIHIAVSWLEIRGRFIARATFHPWFHLRFALQHCLC